MLEPPNSSSTGHRPESEETMRRMIVGGLFGVGLVIAALVGTGWGDPGFGPGPATTAPPRAADSNGLITHLTTTDGQPLTLTVIDAREQWIGVYHVDRGTGVITLKSARKITWDTQLFEFNGVKPTPQEIRSSLNR
jgi:hypothetical protein